MVTQAYHFHATPAVAAKLKLNVKDTDEIKTSSWHDVSKVTSMYASHKEWLDKVVKTMSASVPFVSHAIPHGLTEPFVSHATSTNPPAPPPSPLATDGVVGVKRPRDEFVEVN
jgi:hypothetical protein